MNDIYLQLFVVGIFILSFILGRSTFRMKLKNIVMLKEFWILLLVIVYGTLIFHFNFS